jgi:phosphatidylethanolamine/phosphatidyl-N-methylethanolamine N-methyltransferase
MKPEAVTATYRRWAPVYDRTFGIFTRPGRRLAVAEINRRGGDVLEVGVGTGLSLADYAPHLRVTGIDFSDDMLTRARAKVAEQRLGHVVALRQMDARHLDFPDASFDAVVAMHLVSVVPEPERVIAEMARVCRPGGEILILNHFLHEQGPLAALGGRLAPLADQLGWHSDFREGRVLGEPSLELVERRPSPPFGMFTRLRLRKRAAAAAETGDPQAAVG